ncbi:MAG: hypothetical protein LBU32_30325 [Clostridiales bacterium]|nr:hypothetical protein [Clostridiales bacterium]
MKIGIFPCARTSRFSVTRGRMPKKIQNPPENSRNSKPQAGRRTLSMRACLRACAEVHRFGDHVMPQGRVGLYRRTNFGSNRDRRFWGCQWVKGRKWRKRKKRPDSPLQKASEPESAFRGRKPRRRRKGEACAGKQEHRQQRQA